MKTNLAQKLEDNSNTVNINNCIKWVRIILLIIIIIGLTIIFTRDIWIPKLVGYIVANEEVKPSRE